VTVRLSTSVRAERLPITLARARRVAAVLGISRVTDITRLDRAGVPVFASIRPDARPGSLCVNAGKGTRAAEARVGAYMEAIEFAFAEYNRAGLDVVHVPARHVYEGRHRADAILDFCPQIGADIPLDEPLPCVVAQDITSGSAFLVPAELVFLPLPAALGPPWYFGASSNGLASGNTVLEATVHALAEVIERDIASFERAEDHSALIQPDSVPSPLVRLIRQIERAGLTMHVRMAPSPYGLPYFAATVADEADFDPLLVNAGQACHPSREVAFARAVCEALQSRLSFIHGGRDDLIDTHRRFAAWDSERRLEHARTLLALAARPSPQMRFSDVPDCMPEPQELEGVLATLLDAVRRAGAKHVLRVAYTPPDFPLQVVRIIVPGLELFGSSARVGRRLRDYVRDRI
jgi:ribosomal protein S12 methylthiotransferase accessory factor